MLYHHVLRILGICTVLSMAVSITSCQQSSDNTFVDRPKNIVLLIGDGMGLTQMSSLYFGKTDRVHFERFAHIGLIKTWSAREKVTDSAAAATAFASGVKSYNGALGVDEDTMHVATILEYAADQGLRTGVLATSSITHATPAAFYAHVESRNMHETIAAQLPDTPVHFFAAGGLEFFVDREDGQNLIEKLEGNGFTMGTKTLPESIDTRGKYGFLLAPDGMPRMLDGRGAFLPNATSLALDYLGAGNDGFFMMIESSQIDWGGHANDEDYIITEVQDFNDVVGLVMDFAEANGETLVVVTADHETGGYALSAGENYQVTRGTFSTGGHTATLIPVYAFGPGADSFAGIYQNTDIYHKMMAAWGADE